MAERPFLLFPVHQLLSSPSVTVAAAAERENNAQNRTARQLPPVLLHSYVWGLGIGLREAFFSANHHPASRKARESCLMSRGERGRDVSEIAER